SARRTDQRFMSAHRNELRKPSQGTGGRGRVGSVLRAHLATTTVVDSLSPQRSAGRGLGRGAFDLCLPMVPAELLLSPTLSSTPRRRGGLVVMSRCAGWSDFRCLAAARAVRFPSECVEAKLAVKARQSVASRLFGFHQSRQTRPGL